MKTKVLFLIFFAGNFLSQNPCSALEIDTTDYPDIEYNLLTSKKSFNEIYFKTSFFGLHGIGLKSTYVFSKRFYASLSAEFGVLIQLKFEPQFNSLLAYNVDFRTGYVLHSWVKKKERSYDLYSDSEYHYYYDFYVPVHRELILEAGYNMIPESHILLSENLSDTATLHFNAPAVNIGLKLKSYVYSRLKESDKRHFMGRRKFKGFTELYVGLVVPILPHIASPDPLFEPMPSDKIGYAVYLRFPFSTRKGTSIYLGYQSVGYGGAHQFTLLWSFNMGFGDKKHTAHFIEQP